MTNYKRFNLGVVNIKKREKKINFKSRFYDYNEVSLTYDKGFDFKLKNVDLETAKKIIDLLK